jgi:tetratricopeptide (TPR) repeat protein
MKNRHFWGRFLMSSILIGGLNSCKTTDWSKVTYTVAPNPLEMHGDTVVITVKGTIPPKSFAPKEVVTVTPIIKWNGGEKALKPIIFQGEKVKEGKAIVVAKKTETLFNYSDRVAYQPEMKVSYLVAKAVSMKKEKVKKEIETPKFADGTIVTPLITMSDERPTVGTEQMPRITPISIEADMLFDISQDKVKPKEVKEGDMIALLAFLRNSRIEIMDEKGKKVVAYKPNYTIKNMSISAYASPDGETDKNANLAQDRGKSTAAFISKELRSMKYAELIEKSDTVVDGKKTKVTKTSLEDQFYSITSTPEDWEGFKTKMEASSVPDKDMILRILSTYPDNDKREQEIKNIAKAYTEISEQILPQLRRSKMTISAEKKCKTDEELSKMSLEMPDSLTNEELMYAAGLTQDLNVQQKIYTSLTRVHPKEWRGFNNLGAVYLMMNKVSEAGVQFEKANQLNANNPIILNNLGIIAMKNGDRNKAAEYYGMSNTPQATYNMGRINIMRGKYAEANGNYSSENTFNAALAKMLSGNNDGAMASLDASKDTNSGMGNYLKAIISARKADNAGVAKYLGLAFGKDAALKTMAMEDMEFLKAKEDAAVKALLQ